MRPILVDGMTWRVVRVSPGDPGLVDMAGLARVATADPATRTIRIAAHLVPPLLDKVVLHEIAHAVTMSYDLPYEEDERLATFFENHAIQVTLLASEALGRPVCVRGDCICR